MKIEIEKGISITLTPEQLASIEAQKEQSKSIINRVKTFEDACRILNIPTNKVTFDIFEKSVIVKYTSYEKLKIIAKALNEDVKIDFSNSNQRKWYPYWEFKNGGWSLLSVTYLYSTSSAEVVFLTSKEKAEYIATQFKDLYLDVLNSY